MKCPKCGYEIPEGMLYCEKCGEEIRFVQDFDPELESSIAESLNDFLEELGPEEAGEQEEAEVREAGQSLKTRRRFLVFAVPLALIFFLGLGAGIWVRHYRLSSPDYQVRLADAAISKNNYALAIERLQRAYELNPTQVGLLFEIADYYYLTGNVNDCIITLGDIAHSREASPEQVVDAYRRIVSIYETTGDYEKISEVIAACDNQQVLSLFRDYGAAAPEFDHPGGTYTQTIALKLIASGAGTVYYTLDGEEPTQASERYTAPILLVPGDTTVRAIYVNPYGAASGVVSHTYFIDVPAPDAPEVNLPDGDYASPQVIRVRVPEGAAVYYTTDYKEPTRDALPYTGSIPMPFGSTTYKFVAYNEEGIASEVVTRTYQLKMGGILPATECVNQLLTAFLRYGKIADLQGHAEGVAGRYLYQLACVVHIDSQQSDFYILTEIYEDATGIQSKTGAVYAANVYTGQLFSCIQKDAVTFEIQSDLYYQLELAAQIAAQEMQQEQEGPVQ